MILQADSDAVYLVSPKTWSHAGGYHVLENATTRTQFNGPVLIQNKIIKNAMASTAKAEVSVLYFNAQEALNVHGVEGDGSNNNKRLELPFK